ncbi:MAG: 50S ribosomal protein L15 [Chloroflexi bacterium]|nr:50S ribosomal protein L15 [Chloroflexota bacterium]
MVKQNELAPPPGAKHKRKRVGRGIGSGHGVFSGRGVKGQKARSGMRMRPGFEGGQLPIIKRMPSKRGFTNLFRKEYAVVNLGRLNVFDDGAEITPQRLLEVGLVKSLRKPIKILGNGVITKALTVKANHFSKSAQEKIKASGGRTEVLDDVPGATL